MKSPQRSRFLVPALCAAGFLLWANTGRAAVLVDYQFGADSGSATYDPTTVAGGLAASAISAGSGWTLTSSPSGVNAYYISSTGDPVNAMYTRGTSDDATAVVANQRYFTLTLTPGNDSALSLSSLTFEYNRNSSTQSNSQFFLRTDAGGDNFATTIGSGTMTGSGTGVWNTATVSLSSLASLQDVEQPVTFRIYFFGGTSDTAVTRYDKIIFNGDIASVPEPGTGLLTLAGLGALAFFGRSRLGGRRGAGKP